MNYLKESERTMALQSEKDRTISNADLKVLNEIALLANWSDYIKRKVFYRNDDHNRRLENDGRVKENIGSKLTRILEDRTLTQSQMNLFHVLLGKMSELGELTEALSKSIIDNEDVDRINIIEEVGDDQWYNAIIAREFDFTFDDAEDRNINKLRKRFPDKFTCDDAVNRDTLSEREILEKDTK